MLRESPRTYNQRSSYVGNPETVGRLCGCGQACRPHTRFCGDACRFWAKVQKGPGCWLWTGSRAGGGANRRAYGQFSISRNGKRAFIGAHVFAYEIAFGSMPEGHEAQHSCDVPLCVRNDGDQSHISAGPRERNVADAVARGRYHVPRPRRQVLTVEQIQDIRSLVAGGVLRSRVASDYGISAGYVTRIMDGSARQYDAPLSLPAVERAS
jgi:hypothetical protein